MFARKLKTKLFQNINLSIFDLCQANFLKIKLYIQLRFRLTEFWWVWPNGNSISFNTTKWLPSFQSLPGCATAGAPAASQPNLLGPTRRIFQMNDALNYVAFGLYPYLVLGIFLLGHFVRFFRAPNHSQSGGASLWRHRQLTVGSDLFQVGIIILFSGHFFGLLTPLWFFNAVRISPSFKQGLTIGICGMAGAMCFVAIILLVHRRLTDPDSPKIALSYDLLAMFLLFIQITLGLCAVPVSLAHIDGDEMVKLMRWAQGILTFQPQSAELVADVSPIFRIHLLLGLTLFLIFPFMRLTHFWSVPLWLLGWRDIYVVRAGKRINHDKIFPA